MDELDVVWNTACELGASGDALADTPPGIVQLSYLLRVYNSAMGGGLGFAFEANEDYRIVRAIDAMLYLGLTELAALVEDLRTHMPDWDYIDSPMPYETFAALADGVGGVQRVFRTRAADAPDEFGLRVRLADTTLTPY